MRIRIIRTFANKGRIYQAGTVVDVNSEDANRWCAHGLAMKDKSMDGAPEVKVEVGESIIPIDQMPSQPPIEITIEVDGKKAGEQIARLTEPDVDVVTPVVAPVASEPDVEPEPEPEPVPEVAKPKVKAKRKKKK